MREIRPLRRGILEVSDEPLIAYVVLLALPTLYKERDPDHNDQGVDDVQRVGQVVVRLDALTAAIGNHSDAKGDTDNGHWDEPTGIVDQPGEVKAKLLAKVVLNEIQRLHVLQEPTKDHAK